LIPRYCEPIQTPFGSSADPADLAYGKNQMLVAYLEGMLMGIKCQPQLATTCKVHPENKYRHVRLACSWVMYRNVQVNLPAHLQLCLGCTKMPDEGLH
jgi:hypothetical protein